MGYAHYDRLSALDDSFLELEDANAHMHIGAVGLFEAGPLATPEGGIDIERIRQVMEAGMHRIPRYRQRIARIPWFDHPVWVDDARFNPAYHLRHTHLPRPGDERVLKRLVGRLMSQQLDRGKPLWEMWLVEGLQDGRFAMVTKVHHCLVDGVGSAELVGAVMQVTPDQPVDAEPARWLPRPAPSRAAMFFDEVVHRTRTPFAVARAACRAALNPRDALAGVRETVGGLVDAVTAGLRPASPTPLNVEIGPHRRFDWTSVPLGILKEVGHRAGGTVNDAVLTVLTGALRHFLRRRGLQVDDLDFRAMLPVNVRAAAEQGRLGNRVAMIVARLPLDERSPERRLERIVAETRTAKRSRQAVGMQTIEEWSDATFTTLFVEFSRLAASSRPFNLVVTNVPGPSFPVYLLGARMTACYPLVPLFKNQALGVALFSYAGTLYWGFNADWDAVPDLHELVAAVDHQVEVLRGGAPRPENVAAS